MTSQAEQCHPSVQCSLVSVAHRCQCYLPSQCSNQPVCNSPYPQNESKLLFFVAVVIWAKTKKTGQRGVLPYLSTTYTYLKLLNVVLWFYADPVKGIIYLVLATSESRREGGGGASPEEGRTGEWL